MALTLNPATKVISVPQADLTLVSGTLYELDTNAFRKNVWDLLSSEAYIWMQPAFSHNTEVTIVGVTYARLIEFINGFSVTFQDTGAAYSVRLAGSNNNLFDIDSGILNPTDRVTVIGQNSAGLQTVISGSGVTQQDKDDIEAQIFAHNVEGTENFAQMMRLMRASSVGAIAQLPDGSYLIKSKDGLTNRVDGSLGSNNSRNIDALDPD